MRIAIVGGGSGFAGALVDHLHREGNDIFWICPKKPGQSLSFDIKYTHFPFRANDSGVRHVFESVQAEAIIYLGAQDDTLRFGEGETGGERMLAEVSSLLSLAEQCRVRRFIFISSQEVLGNGAPGQLTEDAQLAPVAARGKYLAGAEQMLSVFRAGAPFAIAVARLSSVFGPQVSVQGEWDFVISMLAEAKYNGAISASAQTLRQPTYIADAVRGVEALLTAETLSGGVYHVSGLSSATDAEIAKTLSALVHDVPVREAAGSASLCLSHEKVTRETRFTPEIPLEEGLRRTADWAKRALPAHAPSAEKQTDTPAGKRKKAGGAIRQLISVFAPYIENVLLLFIFTALAYLLRDNVQFKAVDFMMIYVVLVAAIFGKLHAALATLLASAAHILIGGTGQSFVAILLRYGELAHGAVMFAVGMVVGNVRDQYKLALANHRDEVEYMAAQYRELMTINQTNTAIKTALEQRLLGYGDSFAKIISIISDLDMMEPQRVIQAAVDVVGRVMRSDDVALYLVPDNSRFARLSAASSQSARALGKSIRLEEYPSVMEALSEGQVYVNRQMQAGYPLLAAPVMTGTRMVYIVMLWSMPFERLSPYSVNLLTVIARLISSSADRAFRYNEAVRQEQFIQGTDILNEKAFQSALETQRRGREKGVQEYTLLAVPLPKGDGAQFTDFAEKITALVRDSDSVGILNGRAVVLLRNTARDEALFVIDRFARAGLEPAVLEDAP